MMLEDDGVITAHHMDDVRGCTVKVTHHMDDVRGLGQRGVPIIWMMLEVDHIALYPSYG